MTAESIQILDKHRSHWLTLRDAGYIKQIEYKDKKELEKVYQDEIDKNYHENLWCGACVADMIRRLYTTYESQQIQATVLPLEEKPSTPQPEPVAFVLLSLRKILKRLC
jgi:hypothetical protein